MGLFSFGKKNENVTSPACACNALVEETCCCCGGDSSDTENSNCCNVDASAGIQSIKVLGSGCKSCHEMYENTKVALHNAGIQVEVEYVTNMEKVMAYGIMSMLGLVVNEKVVSMGKVLKSTDIEKLLKKLGCREEML